MNLILAFAAYVAALVALATAVVGGCHPTPGPWRPDSSVIVEDLIEALMEDMETT